MRYLIAACLIFALSLLLLAWADASEVGDGFNGTSFRPVLEYRTADTGYTGWNRWWLGAAIAGQAADVASTAIAISHGAEEANPLFGRHPDYLVLCLVKAALIGSSWLVIEYLVEPPDRQAVRNWTYGSLAVIGGGAALWNTGQVLR